MRTLGRRKGPMQFWPTKAHEWVALITGVVGGLTGLASLIISLLNYRRDRPKLKVSTAFDRVVIGHPGYDPKKRYVMITVTNTGRREVQINRADALFYEGDGAYIVGSGGSVLSEKNPETVILAERENLDLSRLWYFSVMTGAGSEVRAYIHP